MEANKNFGKVPDGNIFYRIDLVTILRVVDDCILLIIHRIVGERMVSQTGVVKLVFVIFVRLYYIYLGSEESLLRKTFGEVLIRHLNRHSDEVIPVIGFFEPGVNRN